MLNLVLGAGAPGAIGSGSLASAVEWVQSYEVDYRIPLTPGRPAVAVTERWLEETGHQRGGGRTKLVRDAAPPALPRPAGIELIARDGPNEDEGFADPFVESMGMPSWAATFFFDLPGTEGWHCYVAVEGDEAVAYVAMLVHGGVAELALASNGQAQRESDGQVLLLCRCIEDAAAAGCRAIFAEVPEFDPEPLSPSRENLMKAGFRQAFVRPDWRPPRHAVAETPLMRWA